MALALVLACPGAAFAQELVVTATEDEGDGVCDATCTLREAVTAANADDKPVTVRLKADTYFLSKGQLELTGDFNIEGAGARLTTVFTDPGARIAYVAPGADVTVADLTVAGGSPAPNAQDAGFGGGFRVAANSELTLSRATVSGNSAASGGGGISTAGTLHVVESTVVGNWAGIGARGVGGGIHVERGGVAELFNATVSNNSAFNGLDDPGLGGGVYTAGSATLEHVTIAQNLASSGGGFFQAADAPTGMWNTLIAGNADQACGGAVGSIEESHNLADDDTCDLGLENEDPGLLPLDDHGGPTDTHALAEVSKAIDAGTADHCRPTDQRLFSRPAAGGCDIGAVERRVTPVVDRHADGDDGTCTPEPDDCTLREALEDSEADAEIALQEGVYEVTLGELELRGSRIITGASARATTLAASGGHRVLTVADGEPTVSKLRVTGGDATQDVGPESTLGGGILVRPEALLMLEDSAVTDNQARFGGGVANLGELFVIASTIAANDATGEGGNGGGIMMAGSFSAFTSLHNSTVSGNSAVGAGGGIANHAARLELTNVTIAGNHALSAGDALYGDATEVDESFFVGDTEMTNTIVAGGEGSTCAWAPDHDVDADHSLTDDESCLPEANGNVVASDLRLGPLSSDYGPTDVHALLDGSPAINAGTDELCPEVDQRGAARPQGVCDIGAFEGGVAATTLRVVTHVLDGPAQASDFTIHVSSGGEELDSAAGSASGTSFALDPGVYRVTRSGPVGYVRAFSGACDGTGEVFLSSGEATTCTITLDHVTAPSGCLDYPTFAQAGGLNLVEDAAIAGDVLQLNPQNGGVGAAWFGAPMPVADGFAADFDFRITPPGGGADGLAFVIQNQGLDALGASGGGIGYQGLRNSLAVEFDTWWNPEYGEPGNRHVAVQSGGKGVNSAGFEARLGPAAAFDSMGDGERHHVRVVYVPGQLEVFADDMTTPKVTVQVNLSALLDLDGGSALLGFTAATGGVVEGHQIESWRYCPAGDPAELSVVTNVVNDSGGSAGASDFLVHVVSAGADVAGSPQPGDPQGTAYSLPAGSYTVSGDARGRRYTIAVGGQCAAGGAITLADGEARECTVTFDDIAEPPAGGGGGTTQPPPPPPPDDEGEELPPPVAGEEVNAEPKSGTVRVKVAGTNRFVELEEGQQIPVGSVVDTTKGRVTIVAAGNQSADFFDGIFRLKQGKGAKPLTTLVLTEKLSCPKRGNASAAARRKKKRRLWGDGSGRFRTEGEYSSATVRGTRWMVEDRCTSTLTKVTHGSVQVRDFAGRKIVVRAGKQYVARAKR